MEKLINGKNRFKRTGEKPFKCDSPESQNTNSSGPDTSSETVLAIHEKLQNNDYTLNFNNKQKAKRSIVWDTFFSILNESGEIIKHHFGCNTCSKVIIQKANATSAMLKHDCVIKRRNIEECNTQQLVEIGPDDKKRT
jgi:hypothetical protein